MESSSVSKLGRQPLPSVRTKPGRSTEIVRRGINQVVQESERRHELSLDSLDKEILQTSRGSKNGHVSLPSDSTSTSSGSAQEKLICLRESLHPESTVPNGHVTSEHKRHQKIVTPNGLYSSHESAPKVSKKPGNEQHQGTRTTGQFHAPTLPMCLEPDVRHTGYRQQVSVNVDGSKHQQELGPWHRSAGALYTSVGNNEMHVKELPFRDAHYVSCNPDIEVALKNGADDAGEEIRRKQASEGPQSGSTVLAEVRAIDIKYRTRTAGGRSQLRTPSKSKISKTPSSKWDDADKWIASAGRNDSATPLSTSSSQGSTPSPLVVSGTEQAVGSCEFESSNNVVVAKRVDSSFSSNSSGITSSVNVKDHIQQIESAIQNSLGKSPPVSDLPKRRDSLRAAPKCVLDVRPTLRSDQDNKNRGDTSIITSTMFIQRPKDSRVEELLSPVPKLPGMEPQVLQEPVSIPPAADKPVVAESPVEAPVKDIFSSGPHTRSASDFPSSKSVRESAGSETTAQPSALYRDMGTQMTPNPSVRLSRGETLGAFNNTNNNNNVSPSRHNTPDQSRRTASLGAPATADLLDLSQNLHTDKHGRRIPSSQPHPTLDRNLNWSTREEEDAESATCLRAPDGGETTQSRPFAVWASAWEEAERAKYTARFHQEEARIKAWEELQKGKADARMRKVEAKLEKLHESASQKMANQIAVGNRKAEEMRAAAQASRDELATKAKHRAEYIRQTGNVPTTMGCFAARLVPFQSYMQ